MLSRVFRSCVYTCGKSKVVQVFKVVCLLGVVCVNDDSQALRSTHTCLTVCLWMPQHMNNANVPWIWPDRVFYITVSLNHLIQCLSKYICLKLILILKLKTNWKMKRNFFIFLSHHFIMITCQHIFHTQIVSNFSKYTFRSEISTHPPSFHGLLRAFTSTVQNG